MDHPLGLPGSQADNSYSYDASGNLTADDQAKIKEIKWRVNGKIDKILFTKDAWENGRKPKSISYYNWAI